MYITCEELRYSLVKAKEEKREPNIFYKTVKAKVRDSNFNYLTYDMGISYSTMDDGFWYLADHNVIVI